MIKNKIKSLLSQKKILLPFIGILVLGLMVFLFLYIKASPQFAVFKLEQAAKARDYAALVKYFNTEAVAKNTLAKNFGKNSIYANSSYGGFADKQQKTIYDSMLEVLLPDMKTHVEAEIKSQLSGGTFMEGFRLNGFLDYLENIKTIGNNTGITVKIVNDKKESLEFGLEKKDGRWQVSDYDLNVVLR